MQFIYDSVLAHEIMVFQIKIQRKLSSGGGLNERETPVSDV